MQLVLFGTLLIASRRSTNAEPILRKKQASTGLFILLFVYSSVSYIIFQTFVCDDLDDGMSYLLVILYVHPGKWLQSGRPSTLVGVIPCSSRNTAVLLGRKKTW